MDRELELIKYLKMMVDLRKSCSPERTNDLSFVCMEEFVLRYGVLCSPAKRPRGVHKRAYKECYSNTTHLLADQDFTGSNDLIYCEGYAVNIIPCHHAWAITHDTTVVDLTWLKPQECVYIGVPFSFKFVKETLASTGMYGIMENFLEGFPLLTGKARPEHFLHEDFRERLMAGSLIP